MKKFEMPEVIVLSNESSVKQWGNDGAGDEQIAIAETYCNH